MEFGVILGMLFFAAVFYFLVSRSPASNLIVSSRSEAEIAQIKRYLESQGINTYTKNFGTRHLHSPGLQSTDTINPSLHVTNVKDLQRAIDLSKGFRNQRPGEA